ncbi:TPA: hypothetical protein HA244_03535 [Candidatus Micrarchaeota archaeon]|nr:hypothetical protein [Candidatus Micrarchaeota archaeon]
MAEVNILVPKHISELLTAIARRQEEVTGAFLYSAHPKDANARIVHAFFLTGVGETHTVQPDQQSLNGLNELLKRLRPKGKMGVMPFHTHSCGTGKEWFHKFSPGDLQAIAGGVRGNPTFVALLYTPEKILAAGRLDNEHVVHTFEATPTQLTNEENVKGLWRQVVKEKGLGQAVFRLTSPKQRRK